jgi:DHA2 family multidrug resistance protein
VLLHLSPKIVIYGVAVYAMNPELSFNIGASIEGWFLAYPVVTHNR